jgi:hypothetical protein
MKLVVANGGMPEAMLLPHPGDDWQRERFGSPSSILAIAYLPVSPASE